MNQDLTRISTIATAMFNAGLAAAAAGTASKQPAPETLRQATILMLGTVLEATPEMATRQNMREASDQAGQETWYQLIALRERTDAGEPRPWSPGLSENAPPGEERKVGMDNNAYQRCLRHLAAAEACMVESIDGWHLARLSHVIESLKEDYGSRLWPIMAAAMTAQ